ncbi:MAG: TetR/AcrR family transcriptional regulator [Actinomycetia bacterium]|nr:TetR/AcrR family transcriptional regulator [Actinomycetes bacterium]MCP4961016.1 TetR/AcrR family transcriptional regulator [Actinomycetes bacterium]
MKATQDATLNVLTRSERRRARTRQAMLDAGQAAIAERGLDKLTIASITEGGDVALGSFYNHFADRDDYLLALTQQTLDEWIADVRRLRSRPFANPLERITASILILFRHAGSNENLRAFLTEVFARSDITDEIDLTNLFRVNLEKAKADGMFTFDDLDLTALLLLGAVRQCLVYMGSSDDDNGDPRLLTRSALRLLGTDPVLAEAALDFAEQSEPYT